jgi:hypothetical protein
MMKILLRILLILIVLGAMFFVPAIPVTSALVVPDSQPEIVSLSLLDVLSGLSTPVVGVTITWEWYSYLALVILLAIMLAVALVIAFIRL